MPRLKYYCHELKLFYLNFEIIYIYPLHVYRIMFKHCLAARFKSPLEFRRVRHDRVIVNKNTHFLMFSVVMETFCLSILIHTILFKL